MFRPAGLSLPLVRGRRKAVETGHWAGDWAGPHLPHHLPLQPLSRPPHVPHHPVDGVVVVVTEVLGPGLVVCGDGVVLWVEATAITRPCSSQAVSWRHTDSQVNRRPVPAYQQHQMSPETCQVFPTGVFWPLHSYPHWFYFTQTFWVRDFGARAVNIYSWFTLLQIECQFRSKCEV